MKNANGGFYPRIIRQVGELLERGYTYQEIADEIGLTRPQVRGIAARNNFKLTDGARKRQQKEDSKKRAETAKINMLINDYSQKKNNSFKRKASDTLCIYCNNTSRYKCTLFNPSVAVPPDGAKYVIKNERGYFVESCDKFELDVRLRKGDS